MKRFVAVVVVVAALLAAACQPIMPAVERGQNQIDLNDLASALAITDGAGERTEEYESLILDFFTCVDSLANERENESTDEMTGSQMDAIKYISLGFFMALGQFEFEATVNSGDNSEGEGIQGGASEYAQIEKAIEMCQNATGK